MGSALRRVRAAGAGGIAAAELQPLPSFPLPLPSLRCSGGTDERAPSARRAAGGDPGADLPTSAGAASARRRRQGMRAGGCGRQRWPAGRTGRRRRHCGGDGGGRDR